MLYQHELINVEIKEMKRAREMELMVEEEEGVSPGQGMWRRKRRR